MFARTRQFSRFACGLLMLACADASVPSAPDVAASDDTPALATSGSGSAPTEEDFASMPPEFRTTASIFTHWTEVGFLPDEQRAFATGYMAYLATNATQEVNLSLRFENQNVASTTARGEETDWLPAARVLFTTARLGVSGTCGHLADGATTHKAWHQFLVGGWKFLSWSNQVVSSGDSKAQPACEPPPPPPPPPGSGGGGNGDEYQGGCELCQQWFYFIDGYMVDEWWECSSIPDYYCEGMMT